MYVVCTYLHSDKHHRFHYIFISDAMWDSLVSRKVTTFRSGQTQESFFTRQILDGHMVSTYILAEIVDILVTYIYI